MREIKFRGWNENELFMHVAFNITSTGKAWMLNENIEHLILMQYTGRDDAEINGTEVWEGDIIENCDTKELQVVFWNEDEACWYCRYINDDKRIVSLADSLGNLNKVIGNVYQNPELLNK